MANSVDPDQEQSDLGLHCLPSQDLPVQIFRVVMVEIIFAIGKEESAGPKEIKLNKKLAMVLGAKIAPRWKELAAALKFPKDDIEYFESENLSDLEHAQKILTLWMVRHNV